MLDFIYDSLDTVKKLKFPSWKNVAQMTAGIFVAVIIAGIYFIGVDTLFSEGYKAIYTAMTGKEVVAASQYPTDSDVMTASGVVEALSGISLQLQSGAQLELDTTT